jgi:hypothetical protein
MGSPVSRTPLHAVETARAGCPYRIGALATFDTTTNTTAPPPQPLPSTSASSSRIVAGAKPA